MKRAKKQLKKRKKKSKSIWLEFSVEPLEKKDKKKADMLSKMIKFYLAENPSIIYKYQQMFKEELNKKMEEIFMFGEIKED